MSRLRSVLGADAIAGDRHGWRFAGRYPRIVVDLDEAERLTAEAEARLDDEPALAGAAAGRALGLPRALRPAFLERGRLARATARA